MMRRPAPVAVEAMRLKRRALSVAVQRAIDLMDAIDAELVDLECGGDEEALNEDGDPLDAGERDGWRRQRRSRNAHTERPRRMAARAMAGVER